MELLERSDQLSALTDSLEAVIAAASGALVLVGGEAGVGKTVLLQAFCERARGSRADPLGRLRGAVHPGPARPALRHRRGDRWRSAGARVQRCPAARGHRRADRRAGRGASDDPRARGPALGRRGDAGRAAPAGAQGEAVPALVVASYRDDELDRTHPLTLVLGELATRAVDPADGPNPLRGRCRPARRAARDRRAASSTAQTDGNPFFVTEVLAAGTGEILGCGIRPSGVKTEARPQPARLRQFDLHLGVEHQLRVAAAGQRLAPSPRSSAPACRRTAPCRRASPSPACRGPPSGRRGGSAASPPSRPAVISIVCPSRVAITSVSPFASPGGTASQ